MSETVESTNFGGLTIAFNARVLRPRPWTLAQSRWAAELLAVAPPGPVLELCCGAGHLGLAAIRASDRPVTLVDIDPVACDFARANAARAGLAERVEVRCAQVDTALASDERFAVIIADPPWVPTAAATLFPADPVRAIDGGVQGLDIARACLATMCGHLQPEGSAVIQLGTDVQLAALIDEFVDELRLVEMRTFAEHGILAQLTLRAHSLDQ